ncbi:hypothetical protein DUI87_30564 [Hirundo rustica rustica]|uniref:Uncharacterized protein n=1 Tax=Hirundo rustica rustica TaxID=333673 RepID=A0A3M0IX63_HIRRU|nr:hypothetical protein DUI87_30564 [Hirundo rustica rustica]
MELGKGLESQCCEEQLGKGLSLEKEGSGRPPPGEWSQVGVGLCSQGTRLEEMAYELCQGRVRLVAMSRCAGLLSTSAGVGLLLLLGSVLFSCSSLSDTVPEFALTKIEESDIKDDSGKEPVTEDDADPEDLEVFYPTDQWQTLRPEYTFFG